MCPHAALVALNATLAAALLIAAVAWAIPAGKQALHTAPGHAAQVDESTVQKISLLTPNIGMTYSGMGPDSRVLVRLVLWF